MEVAMMVSSLTAKLTAVEGLCMLMETIMKVNGTMIKFMDMEFTRPRMEVDMKDNGQMMPNKVKEKRAGQMDPFTQETTSRE